MVNVDPEVVARLQHVFDEMFMPEKSIEDENKELKETVEKLKQQLLDDANKADGIIMDLRDTCLAFRIENEDLTAENARLNAENARLAEKVDNTEGDKEFLIDNARKDLGERHSSLLKGYLNLTAKNISVVDENMNFADQIEASAVEIARRDRVETILRGENEALFTENESLEMQTDYLVITADLVCVRLADKIKRLIAEKGEYVGEIEDLVAEVNRLKGVVPAKEESQELAAILEAIESSDDELKRNKSTLRILERMTEVES